MSPRIVMIDNYDSFTYNLVQVFAATGAEVVVLNNDETSPHEVRRLGPTHVVISPGPGRPEHAGVSMGVVEELAGTVPILGVCLGHQAIAAVFGAKVGSAAELMHGKTSPILHDGDTLFAGLSNPFLAGRYHSLAVIGDSVPAELEVSARTADGEVMGIRHRLLGIEGVQFHPESVLTPEGDRLLANYLVMVLSGAVAEEAGVG